MEPVYEGPPLYRHWGLPEDSSVLARPAPDKKKNVVFDNGHIVERNSGVDSLCHYLCRTEMHETMGEERRRRWCTFRGI